MDMVLNTNYAGWLELYSPYSADRTKLKVGRPGDSVKVLSTWTDKGETWSLVRIHNEFEGWVLESELTTRNKIEN